MSRSHVLFTAMKLMDRVVRTYGRHRSGKAHGESARRFYTVSVGFTDEVGHGLGPTLEFYTLVCHNLQVKGMGLWRGDTEAWEGRTEAKQATEEKASPEHVEASNGLFPAIIPPST